MYVFPNLNLPKALDFSTSDQDLSPVSCMPFVFHQKKPQALEIAVKENDVKFRGNDPVP